MERDHVGGIHEPPVDEFVLCEDTAMVAVDGACPAHNGDACLQLYVPAADLAAARGRIAELEAQLRTDAEERCPTPSRVAALIERSRALEAALRPFVDGVWGSSATRFDITVSASAMLAARVALDPQP